MNGIDWLSLCRRVVAAQGEIFARHRTSGERTEYEGIGSGGDRTLVIDRLCEDVVFAELEALVAAGGPALRVVSEERGEVFLGEHDADGGAGATVIVDPIDGSLNARRTIPAHSFCLAVASGPAMADVEFGFVHDFGTGEEFAARRGAGATLNGEPLPSLAGSGRGGASGGMVEVVGIESAEPGIAAPVMEALGGHVHRLRVVGSIAITLCQVAAGRFDGMLSLRPCRSVDVAAAQLVVLEAGGHVATGPYGIEDTGFGLEERYPIRAAGSAEGLEFLARVQESSPGFS